jgi:hypothetical protein
MTRPGRVAGCQGIRQFSCITPEVIDYTVFRVSSRRLVAPRLQKGGPDAALYGAAVYGLW